MSFSIRSDGVMNVRKVVMNASPNAAEKWNLLGWIDKADEIMSRTRQWQVLATKQNTLQWQEPN